MVAEARRPRPPPPRPSFRPPTITCSCRPAPATTAAAAPPSFLVFLPLFSRSSTLPTLHPAYLQRPVSRRHEHHNTQTATTLPLSLFSTSRATLPSLYLLPLSRIKDLGPPRTARKDEGGLPFHSSTRFAPPLSPHQSRIALSLLLCVLASLVLPTTRHVRRLCAACLCFGCGSHHHLPFVLSLPPSPSRRF